MVETIESSKLSPRRAAPCFGLLTFRKGWVWGRKSLAALPCLPPHP